MLYKMKSNRSVLLTAKVAHVLCICTDKFTHITNYNNIYSRHKYTIWGYHTAVKCLPKKICSFFSLSLHFSRNILRKTCKVFDKIHKYAHILPTNEYFQMLFIVSIQLLALCISRIIQIFGLAFFHWNIYSINDSFTQNHLEHLFRFWCQHLSFGFALDCFVINAKIYLKTCQHISNYFSFLRTLNLVNAFRNLDSKLQRATANLFFWRALVVYNSCGAPWDSALVETKKILKIENFFVLKPYLEWQTETFIYDKFLYMLKSHNYLRQFTRSFYSWILTSSFEIS